MGLVDSVRAIPRAAWVLFLGCFINRFGSFVVPFLLLYLTRSGFAPAEGGMVVGIYGLGQVCASMLGGSLTDRIGARRTIVLSMFLAAAVTIALWAATGFGLVAFLTFGLGLSAELYQPASGALIASLVASPRRVTSYAFHRLATNAGFAAGPAIAGILADQSFFWLFLGDALSSLAFGTLALAALPAGETPGSVAAGSSNSALGGATPGAAETARLVSVANDRAFVRFLAASLLLAFAFFQYRVTFALYVRDLGLSNAIYGALVSINGAVVVLLEVPLTSLTRRLPARPVMAAGILLASVGFALTGMAGSTVALAATVVLWSLGEILVAPVAAAHVADLAPVRLRGLYMGAYTLSFSLGLTLGPGVGVWLYAQNARALWAVCGILGTLSATLILRRGRNASARMGMPTE